MASKLSYHAQGRSTCYYCMSILAREVRNVQNPALGAGMIWRFTCGYVETHRAANPVPLPLVFLVLPMLFHEQTEEFIRGTQRNSGLRAFAAKFGQSHEAKQDVLLTIHERMLRLRRLSVEALRIAIATRLISVELRATVIPLSRAEASAGLSNEARQLMRGSEKLGSWCALLTMHEISSTLKVRF